MTAIGAFFVAGMTLSVVACESSVEPQWGAYVLTTVGGMSVPFTETVVLDESDTTRIWAHSASIRLRPAGVFEAAFKISRDFNTADVTTLKFPTSGTYTRSNGQIAFYAKGAENPSFTGTIANDTMVINNVMPGLDVMLLYK